MPSMKEGRAASKSMELCVVSDWRYDHPSGQQADGGLSGGVRPGEGAQQALHALHHVQKKGAGLSGGKKAEESLFYMKTDMMLMFCTSRSDFIHSKLERSS